MYKTGSSLSQEADVLHETATLHYVSL